MTRVDLDKLDRYAGDTPEDFADMIWAVTAELRAAREVVEAAKFPGEAATAADRLDEAIRNYDEVVGQ